MKKISFLFCMMFFLSTSITQATMNEYKKPGFDFSTIKTILILDTKEDSRKSKITNDFALRHVDGELNKALEDSGLRVAYMDQAIKEFNIGNPKPHDVLVVEVGKEKADELFFAWAKTHYQAYLTPSVIHYKNSTHREPSRVVARREIERVRVYDEYSGYDHYGHRDRNRRGNYRIVERPRTVYVTIPERYYQSSDICIKFELSSMANHEEILLLRDERTREGSDSFDGMTTRICENLTKKLSQNIPTAKLVV